MSNDDMIEKIPSNKYDFKPPRVKAQPLDDFKPPRIKAQPLDRMMDVDRSSVNFSKQGSNYSPMYQPI